MIRKIQLALLAISGCVGCRDQVNISGVILEDSTKNPISNVYISQKDISAGKEVEDLDSSDSRGHFHYKYPLLGKLTDNKFATLYFFKRGVTMSYTIANGEMDYRIIFPTKFMRNQ